MPPKKKGKGKAKGKKGAKDKSKKKTKAPTEKELFEKQIDGLKQQLEAADSELQHDQDALDHSRQLFDTEVESKVLCVAHLKQVSQAENDRRMEVQQKLQMERDLAELVEKRALVKFAVTDHNEEAAKSLFLKQKSELEGKLSLLEELRLARGSQQAHLKRVEDALQEKITIFQEKSREEDMNQVDKLLKNREIFQLMCRDIKKEWIKVFELRLPVHAKRQLEENVRLRDVCDRSTENLLQVQDRSRVLKKLQKSLELEEEIQTSIEDNVKTRRTLQEKRLQRLQEASRVLQSATVPAEKHAPKSYTTEMLKRDASFFAGGKWQDFSPRANAVNGKISSIREREIEKCQLEDRLNEMDAILKDQMTYKNSLECDVEAKIDRNGKLMSAILRAGKVFQTRCGKLAQEDLDLSVLYQMRMLLELGPEEQHEG